MFVAFSNPLFVLPVWEVGVSRRAEPSEWVSMALPTVAFLGLQAWVP